MSITIEQFKTKEKLSSLCKVNIIFIAFVLYFSLLLGSTIDINFVGLELFPVFFNIILFVLGSFVLLNYKIFFLFKANNNLILEKNKKIENFKNIIEDLKNKLNENNVELLEYKTAVNKYKNEILIYKKKEEKYLEEIERLKKEIERLNDNNKKLEEKLEYKKEEYNKLFMKYKLTLKNIEDMKFYLLNLLIINNNHLNNKFKNTLNRYLTLFENLKNN